MEPMSTATPGGDLEQAALACLWKRGSATAREVHDDIGAPAKLAYTTITKVLDRLFAKGLIARERAGKAFVYRGRVAREKVYRALARRVVGRLLGDDPKPAVVHLVDAVADLDPELLDELARAVSAKRRSRRGS